MTKRTPAQKLARQLQAQTGKPYTACLAVAKERLAACNPNGTTPQPGSTSC
ncbi:hypothetical protein [Streptomyces sp. NPDC008150]|uniref:hypothetical protein n=1 Tax=Streptomyces sp. NPDC008150 TaxID=3364816 RepID=UPI0036EAB41E